MADEKKSDDKKLPDKKPEDLTPTPTQAEMDEIMSKMTGEKKPQAKAGAELKHATPVSDPPTMTQAENDAAMELAAPGDDMSEPKKKQKEDKEKKEKENQEAEARRKKDMEASQAHPAGYKTK